MNREQRDQRTVASRTRGWLAVAMATFLVVGSVSLGVAGVTAVEPGESSADSGATDGESVGDAARLGQQTGPLSGLQPLADADTKLVGAGANDTFGSALAHGDVNGDGVEDVVVGAPLNDTANGNNSGAVYVFYGPVNESEIDAGSANVTLAGADNGDWAGYSVATGDVNDDNHSDVVVGAPLEDAGGASAGSTYVVYGGDLAGNVSLADANHTFVGEGAGDLAGLSVGTANRTGGDDVLVGAPRNNSTAPDAGAAYVLSDAETGTSSLANATTRLVGEGAGDLAGWSVASAGDFDGNDTTDVVVGARRNNSTAPDAGAAYVVTANASGTVSLADAQVKLAGVGARDNAGWEVAEAGDVNDDNHSDVVVGAPFNDSGGTNAGAAYVAYGGSDVSGTMTLSDAGVTLVGEGPSDNAGQAVSSAGSGDVTCDAYADVLVGAPGNNSTAPNAGAAYVVAGEENLSGVHNLSAADAKLVGEGEDDEAGSAVSGAGDATGNGSNDVLVGAPFNDTGGFDAGAAYAIAGDCPEKEERTTTTTTTPPTTTTTTTTTTTETPTTTTTTRTPTTTTTTETPTLEIAASSPECEVLELENPTDRRVFVQFIYLDDPANEGEFVLEPGETQRFETGQGRIELTASTASISSADPGERVLVNGNEKTVIHIDACPTTTTTTTTPTTTTTTATPTTTTRETTTTTTKTTTEQPRIEFIDCKSFRVHGSAAEIEVTTAYFVEGEPGEFATDLRSVGPVSGTTVISAGDLYPNGGPNYVLSSVTLYDESMNILASAQNPDAEECLDSIRPTTTTTTTTATTDTTQTTQTTDTTRTTTDTTATTETTQTTETTETTAETTATTQTTAETTETTSTTTTSAACLPGLQAKFEGSQSGYSLETLEGASSLDVSASGNAQEATITNDEPYALDVYVFAGGSFERKGTVQGDGGTLAVEGITTTNPGGQEVTHDIGNIALGCAGEGPPTIPPYSNVGESITAPALQSLDDGEWQVVNPTNASVEFTAATFDGSETASGSLDADANTTVELPTDQPVLLLVDGVVVDVAGLDAADDSSNDRASEASGLSAGDVPTPVHAITLVGLFAAAGLVVHSRD